MATTTRDSFGHVLDGLLAVIRSEWTWPSPEVGFARQIFEQSGEPMPVPEDRDLWPVHDRLVHAPALAATGYLLGGQGRVLRPEWQKAWGTGFERLSERDAFPIDRMSFAFRPIYVLGLAVGAANCPVVGEKGRDWIRGVIRRLLQDGSTEPWADLIYGTAAQAVGVKWRDRLLVQLDGAAPEVLGLLRWLTVMRSAAGAGGLADLRLLDAELVRRCAAGLPPPSDVARAAVIYNSLCQAVEDTSAPGRSGADLPVEIDPATLQGLPPGAVLHFTIIKGDHVGDNISIGRDNIGSAVGRSASVVARDISVFREAVNKSVHMDDDLKAKLTQAREAVEKADLSDADKADVAQSLRKLADELDKPDKNPGLVRRFWNRINEVAPTISSIVASAASISEMING